MEVRKSKNQLNTCLTILRIVMVESGCDGSALSRASGLYDNWQGQSLCQNLFLIKFKAFPRSNNNGACGGFCNRICF